MGGKIRQRRGPRMRSGGEVRLDLTGEVREFRAATEGLSHRLPLASLEQMRAGSVANPYTLARRYLHAGWRMGLTREWGLRFAIWARRQVDALWPASPTPLRVLEVKALQAENHDDLCEKLRDTEADNLARLEARIASLTAEIALDTETLAGLHRERERLTR